MKQRLIDRLIWWFCDTFGHAKYDACRMSGWSFGSMSFYVCKRCNRIVNRPATQDGSTKTATAEKGGEQ